MVLLGTVINCVSIVVGTLFGMFMQRIPERVKTTVLQGIGLSVFILGIQMGLKSEQFILVILSLALGGILGELWGLDDKLNLLGKWLENKIGTKDEGAVAKGFVTATLIFVIGAMAILGALDSGLRNDHNILFTKSILDGFTSFVLATTLGVGVIFSAIPVFIYQGSLAMFATQIDKWIPPKLMELLIVEITATGGIMIIAIGLNMLGITKIRVANMLPSLLFVSLFVTVLYFWPILP
ncbi:DUF554 domain-containing protein [Cytobacillus sp. IB215665]|uniref:DUF554 domain-containing protein n=1 Tax=Cytobacillus sp. IB215665 TaxID=3097357 RepID=UPI002A0CD404|nr:DUF554 domain-containing protein [Cytobacillus sp. IB215665]MDX8363550.1 DUF554 domain-containing protein [Cytobacillus sp. IB215665]